MVKSPDTAEEKKRIAAAFVKRDVSMNCSSCGFDDARRPLGYMVLLPSASPDVALPLVPTVCRSCAEAKLYAIAWLDLDDIVGRYDPRLLSPQRPIS